MEARFDYAKAAPEGLRALAGVEEYLHTCGLEESLLTVVRLRVSQINGCAVFVDMDWDDGGLSVGMHWKELRAFVESEKRLYGLASWRQVPYYAYFTARERAALAWTEAVTLAASTHVPDSVYNEVSPCFNEKEMSDLTLAIGSANAWNRLSLASLREASLSPVAQAQEQRRAS